MSLISIIRQPIRAEMEEFERRFTLELQSSTPLLQEILRYLLLGKGKRFRPMLVFLSAKLFSQVTDDSYTAASLVEMLHTATLVHDDVVDESDQRRGNSSVNALWNPKIAVLAGDFLLSHGLHLALERKSFESLEVVSRALKEMSEGELMQIHKAGTLDLSEQEYYRIIHQKTAALIAICTETGARSVSCTPGQAEQMRIYGENLGMAFQIRDDLFDLLPGNGSGKPAGNDLKEHKLTLPLIYALARSSDKDRNDKLDNIRIRASDPEFARELFGFVEERGGIAYAEERMAYYGNQALDALKSSPDNESRKSLELMVQFAIERDI